MLPLNEKDQETKRWLDHAKSDLEAGRRLVTDAAFSSQAAFFAQQVAEKALKGFLVWHQVRFKKEHDIRSIGNLALVKDQALQAEIDAATALNPFAVTFRYPGEEVGPSPEEAEEALATAEALFKAILARLPATVHP